VICTAAQASVLDNFLEHSLQAGAVAHKGLPAAHLESQAGLHIWNCRQDVGGRKHVGPVLRQD